MHTEIIREKANALVKKSATRDPFEIAQNIGVKIMYMDKLNALKGMYTVIKRNRFIIINSNLSDDLQRIVCAHELGHDTLHREIAKRGALQEFMLYDMKTRPEYEANSFAAEILLDDSDVEELILYGYDMQQIAMQLHSDINLIGIKVSNMNLNGAKYTVPILPRGDFLRN